MAKKLRVLFVASESRPYSATGGLADVSEALPVALVKKGIIVNKVLPKYKGIEDKFILKEKCRFMVEMADRAEEVVVYHRKDEGVNTYFIANDRYFERDEIYGYEDDGERFGFFSKAVVQVNMILGFKPDVIHLNDWQAAMISLLLRTEYRNLDFYSSSKLLYTIHNLQYQGVFNKYLLNEMRISDRQFNQEGIEYYGKLCFMKAGIVYSDIVSTVSDTYSKEIQTEQYGYGLDGILLKYADKIRGIVNGIYYDKYDPNTDEMLEYKYNTKTFVKMRNKQKKLIQKDLGLAQKDVPIFGVVTRLVEQKGVGLIIHAIEKLAKKDVQFIVLGSGDESYEKEFKRLQEKYPDKIRAKMAYDGKFAKKIYSSSDFFLMPSLFEPCGLSQLYSMRYGSLPIVRSTGGLKDTVVDYTEDNKKGTGFKFDGFNADEFMQAIDEAISLYEDKDKLNQVIKRAMSVRFSWEASAGEYLDLYKEMLK